MKGVLIAAALIFGLMILIKDGRVLRNAGLTGGCITVAAPRGQTGTWETCTPGKLQGAPNLTRQGCTSFRSLGKTELWRCPESIQSSPGS